MFKRKYCLAYSQGTIAIKTTWYEELKYRRLKDIKYESLDDTGFSLQGGIFCPPPPQMILKILSPPPLYKTLGKTLLIPFLEVRVDICGKLKAA